MKDADLRNYLRQILLRTELFETQHIVISYGIPHCLISMRFYNESRKSMVEVLKIYLLFRTRSFVH